MKAACPDCGLVHYTIHCPDDFDPDPTPDQVEQLELAAARALIAEHTGRVDVDTMDIAGFHVVADDDERERS